MQVLQLLLAGGGDFQAHRTVVTVAALLHGDLLNIQIRCMNLHDFDDHSLEVMFVVANHLDRIIRVRKLDFRGFGFCTPGLSPVINRCWKWVNRVNMRCQSGPFPPSATVQPSTSSTGTTPRVELEIQTSSAVASSSGRRSTS